MTANFAAPVAETIRSSERASSSHRLTPAELERNQRVERYLPLVAQVLSKIRRTLPAHADVGELYSAGVTGLIAAVERFDPSQAESFPGYVCLRVRGAILDELRRLDPCSRMSRSRARKIQQAIADVEQALGRAPTDAEVSERLQISTAEFQRWRETSTPVRVVSLDVPADNDPNSGGALHELIADDHHECVRDRMEHDELKQILTARIAELPEIQRRILALYYFEGLRFAEIGEVFDLTETRVCQIHKQTVKKLQAYLQSARQR